MGSRPLSLSLVRHVALRVRAKYSAELPARICERIGMPNPLLADDEHAIDVVTEAAFVQAVCNETGDIDLGFKAGLTHATPGTLPAYVSRHARTVRDALQNVCKYMTIVRPGMDFRIEELGNVAALRLTVSDPRLHAFPRHRESIYAGVISKIRAFTGRAFYPEALSLTHQRRPIGAAVRSRLGCTVDFGAENNEMLMTLQSLDGTMSDRDDILRQILVARGEVQLAELERPEPGIAEKVELLVQSSFPGEVPTVDSVASSLGLSRRTLSRRLYEAGTSYHDILSHVRLRIAILDLEDTHLQIAEIAYQLGFASQASFSTAFRRETGLSPREFRARSSAALLGRVPED
jgi:AraC-like DNA-binding protein